MNRISIILCFIALSLNSCKQTSIYEKSIIDKVSKLNAIGFENNITKQDIREALQQDDDTLSILIKLLVNKKKCLFIDENNIIGGSPVFYTQLFNDLHNLDPNFNFTSIFTELKEGDDFDYYFDKAAYIGFDANNAHYETYLYFDDKIPVSPEFHQLANRALTDIEAQKRFYTLNYLCKNCTSDYFIDSQKVDLSKIAIVSLTQAQADAIRGKNIFSITEYNHQLLKTQEVISFVNDMEKQNILSNATLPYRKHIKEEIQWKYFEGYDAVLTSFDSAFCLVTREVWSSTPYRDILQCMSNMSQNNFMPSQIKDNFTMDTMSLVSFQWDGALHEKWFNNRGTLMDVTFFEWINEILRNKNVNGSYYFLNNFENEGFLMYLSNEQFNFLNQTKKLSLQNAESLTQYHNENL